MLANFKPILFVCFLLIWVFIMYLNTFYECYLFCGKASTILLTSLSLLLVIRSIYKKNMLYVIFFSFITLYAIVPKYLFFNHLFISAHNQNYTYYTIIHTSLIFALFLIVVNYFIKIPNGKNIPSIQLKNNVLIFWFYIVICLLITLFGKSGENIFSGEGYGQIQMQHSSLNEYILIFFLLAYLYHGGKKFQLYILYFIAFIFCFKNLMMGGRIETIMTFLLFFTLRLQYVFSFKITMLSFIIGVWFMNVFNTIRANPFILLSSDWYNVFNPFIKTNNHLPYLVTNEGDVFWASERLLILIQETVLTYWDRFVSLVNFLIASFVPFSFLPPLANLSTYRTDLYESGGGGLLPVFVYVFLSYPGVILLGYVIAKFLNKFNDNYISGWIYIYIVLLIATLPRWFAYYPIHLIKFCVYGVLIYFLTISFEFTMDKYSRKNI